VAYRGIADEEAGHAQLAWDLHLWLMAQLSSTDRAEVLAAQRAALARLPGIAVAQQRMTPAALGLPGEGEVVQVAAAFCAGLHKAA
jgi:hypothetical protein